jgi:hypothetical protein
MTTDKDSLMVANDNLVTKLTKLLTPLRIGEPIDGDEFDNLKAGMRALMLEIAKNEMLPKPLVRCLLEIYPLFLGVAAGRTDHSESETIEEWAEEVLEIVLQAL